ERMIRAVHLHAWVLVLVSAIGCARAPVTPPAVPSTASIASVPDGGTSSWSGGIFRLPEGVRPTAQAVSLRVDPAQPRFSGSVDITLAVDRPLEEFWVSARGLQASAASLLRGSERWPVTLEADDPRGAARVRIGRTLPTGQAILHVEFEAPFNPRLVGI